MVHHAFEEENRQLGNIVKTIENQLEKLQQIPRYYGNDFVEQVLDNQRQQQLQKLQLAQPEPYFGRLDFEAHHSGKVTPLYIGKVGVQDSDTDQLLVIDWRAPIASMFYSFTGQGDTASYESPDGEITGTIHLKRNLAIRKQVLQRIVDSYVRGSDNLGVSDEFLLYRLGENKDNRLRDIVSTIQYEQDQIIRADRNKALIIQGVPGSGKTTVALHRLAFLLYQYQDKIQAEKIIIFAPNNMFLDYISDVLPELGVGGVQQTTFAEWVLAILNEQEEIEYQHPSQKLSQWFETNKDHVFDSEQISRYKGSIAYMKRLEAALSQYEATYVPQKSFTAWDGMELSESQIRQWFYDEYKHYPLVKRRERVFARIKRWIETEHKQIVALDPKGTLKKKANQRFKTYTKSWPHQSLTELYASLLTTPALNSEASTNDSLQQDLSNYFNKKQKVVEYEDLAPLLFIYHKLYGIESKYLFHHVVIDEAQDFSPFQVAVLQQHCPSQSFTILGDLLQNIYAFQGIERWQEMQELFDEERFGYFQLDRSYRSTLEIIRFANEVISAYNQEITPAKPVFRSGEPVRLIQVKPAKQMIMINQAIERMTQNNANTIAIITRTEQGSQEIYQSLSSMGVEANLISSQQSEYLGGISIAPIYLTKGMEFDAVLLVGVDENNYTDQALDAKLLYVGCTRALHQLWLLYTDQPSPLVKEINPQFFSSKM